MVLLFVGLAALGRSAPDTAAIMRVTTSLQGDPSMKVRLQALRVLGKLLEKGGEPASDVVIAALSRAAAEDPEHLVRGLACFTLGKLRDPRAGSALARAQRDPHPFVRAQAEQAVGVVAGPVGEPPRRVLVIGAGLGPGVEAPPELAGTLARLLTDAIAARAKGYTIVSGATGRGYELAAVVSRRGVGGPTAAVELTVSVAISAVPERALRHAVSASASAPAGAPVSAALEEKVLRAAVERVAADVMGLIEPGTTGEGSR